MATKKQKFESVVSALGTLLELVVSFGTGLKKRGVSFAEALIQLAGNSVAQEEVLVILERLVRQAAAKILWTVTSNGRTAGQLIADLEAKGRVVTGWAKDVVSKPQFVTTNGKTYHFVGIRGDEFSDEKRTTANIFAEGARRGYLKATAESAVLLRKQFAQEQLGVPYVVVMHEPISDSYGYPHVLGLDRDDGDGYLRAWWALPENRWDREDLFLFLAPQEE